MTSLRAFRRNMTDNPKKGFTLIELLVVISIVSLLSSVILVQTQEARKKGANANITRQIQEYEKALYLYREDNGFFPPFPGPAPFYCLGDKPDNPATGCGANGGTPSTNDANFKNALWPKYMSSIPNPNKKMLQYGGINSFSATYRCVNDAGGVVFTPTGGCLRARLMWYVNGNKSTSPTFCATSNSRTCCNYSAPNTQCSRYLK